jgi:hypothetical protein
MSVNQMENSNTKEAFKQKFRFSLYLGFIIFISALLWLTRRAS